jgi:hypothetical protein
VRELDTGCELKEVRACIRLAAYFSGEKHRDMRRAVTAGVRSCELGLYIMCEAAAEALTEGMGGDKNPELARKLLVIGCNGGDRASCTALKSR